jgi:hypothetical protein
MSKRNALTGGQMCMSCRWWDVHFDEDYPGLRGSCRRYPPVIIGNLIPHASRDLYDAGEQPVTHKIDWCGEWAAEKEENS